MHTDNNDNMANGLTHFDSAGNARMVNVTEKKETERCATACGMICVSPQVLQAIREGTAAKGDVLGTARIAGIMALKRTDELIPLCHSLPVTGCSIDFEYPENECAVRALCAVSCFGKTGVEMEALTGVSAALLTIYDMCKAIDKRMVIKDIHLVKKTGGKSGTFLFDEVEK